MFNALKDEFVSLQDLDFDGQWTNIALDELDESEQSLIERFHSFVAQGQELDTSNVLLVQAEGGFLKEIYAASLRQSEDGGLVVKLGANVYPATIETSERSLGKKTITEYVIACGDLFGAIEFADKESEVDVKIDNASTSTKVTYTRCWVEMTDGSNEGWRVPLTLDLTKQPTKVQVLDAVAAGTLATYLKPVAGGGEGGEALKMADLGAGEFPVGGFRKVETKNGERWLIFVDGFGDVWSRGGAERQITNDVQRAKLEDALGTTGVTLKVGNIKVMPDGKTFLDSALRVKRGAQGAMKSAAPVDNFSRPQDKEVAQALGKLAMTMYKSESPKTTTAAVVNFDEIPF